MKFLIRAGSDLFFISMKFSYFNFFKVSIESIGIQFWIVDPGIVTVLYSSDIDRANNFFVRKKCNGEIKKAF
jgi:hypothetical protein